MADEQLSQQDIQDLQEITSKLPAGHPMQKNISMLINSQPTQFENENTATADSGNPIERTINGVGRGLNNIVEGMYQTMAHPINTASSVVDQTEQHFNKGMAEPTALGKAAEFGAAVPILGPFGQQLGQRAGGGDVAGAVSEGLTTALAPSIAKEVPKLMPKIPSMGDIGSVLRDPGRQYEGKFPASTSTLRGPLKPGFSKIPVIGSFMDALAPGHPSPFNNAPEPLPSAREVVHSMKPWGMAGPNETVESLKPWNKLGPNETIDTLKPWDAATQAVNDRIANQIPRTMPKRLSGKATVNAVTPNTTISTGAIGKSTLPSSASTSPFSSTNPNMNVSIGLKFTKPANGALSEVSGESGSTSDLITRNRKISIAGEEPSPSDLKRAGDLTQAPLSRLRALAKFDDKLAQSELRRRLKQ